MARNLVRSRTYQYKATTLDKEYIALLQGLLRNHKGHFRRGKDFTRAIQIGLYYNCCLGSYPTPYFTDK